MSRPARAYKIKFPELPDNIETLDIKYKGRHLKRYEGKDLAGMKWKDFQSMVGKDCNLNDRFFYNIFFSDGTKTGGSTQAINSTIQENSMNDKDEIIKSISALEKRLSAASKEGGISFDMLLESTKAGYEARIEYLNLQIRDKDANITELKAEILSLIHI